MRSPIFRPQDPHQILKTAPSELLSSDPTWWSVDDVVSWVQAVLEKKYPNKSFAELGHNIARHMIDGPVLMQLSLKVVVGPVLQWPVPCPFFTPVLGPPPLPLSLPPPPAPDSAHAPLLLPLPLPHFCPCCCLCTIPYQATA